MQPDLIPGYIFDKSGPFIHSKAVSNHVDEARLMSSLADLGIVINTSENEYFKFRSRHPRYMLPCKLGFHGFRVQGADGFESRGLTWKHSDTERFLTVPYLVGEGDLLPFKLVPVVLGGKSYPDLNVESWALANIFHVNAQPDKALRRPPVEISCWLTFFDEDPWSLVNNQRRCTQTVSFSRSGGSIGGSRGSITRVFERPQQQYGSGNRDNGSYYRNPDLYPRGHGHPIGRYGHVLLGLKIAALIACGIAGAGIGVVLAFWSDRWLSRPSCLLFLGLGAGWCATFYGWAAFGAPWEFWRLPFAWGRYWLGLG
jgi:hypothetical protein